MFAMRYATASSEVIYLARVAIAMSHETYCLACSRDAVTLCKYLTKKGGIIFKKRVHLKYLSLCEKYAKMLLI